MFSGPLPTPGMPGCPALLGTGSIAGVVFSGGAGMGAGPPIGLEGGDGEVLKQNGTGRQGLGA